MSTHGLCMYIHGNTEVEDSECYNTVFIQIVAVATINFSIAGVWLLIKGGSYSRVAFINFGAISLGVIINRID